MSRAFVPFALSALIVAILVVTSPASAISRTPIARVSATAPATTGGKIAFVSDRDGNPEIYVMNADGSGQRNLTLSPAFEGAPAWSPDGRRIAFTSDRDGGTTGIYLMNADGSGLERLTRNLRTVDDLSPTWSPDGRRIAFVRTRRGGSPEIYVMDADGSQQRRLARSLAPRIAYAGAAGPAGELAWSPNGRKIAFQSPRDDNKSEIYVMNADGTGRQRLTVSPETYDGVPAWSPDGRRIAYARGDNTAEELYVMNADGSEQKKVTPYSVSLAYAFTEPSWSPDGRRIAFWKRDRAQNKDIYVVNVDGSGLRRLTRNPGQDGSPSWQPLSSRG
jgi:TolB protein